MKKHSISLRVLAIIMVFLLFFVPPGETLCAYDVTLLENTVQEDTTQQEYEEDSKYLEETTEKDLEEIVSEEANSSDGEEVPIAENTVLPTEIHYRMPQDEELEIEAPDDYTYEIEKSSARSSEEYITYTQRTETGETLHAPEIILPEGMLVLTEDAEPSDALITGWMVMELTGAVLAYEDGTQITEGEVIPAECMKEIQLFATEEAAEDKEGIVPNTTLLALEQDMTVVQCVGTANTTSKTWPILVQGGSKNTSKGDTTTTGTTRHAYGTLKAALNAINSDTGSNEFKITLLEDYTATYADREALGTSSVGSGAIKRDPKPTIYFTGALNYEEGISYDSWKTLNFNSSSIYFEGFSGYFTKMNIQATSGANIYCNQNDMTFHDVKFLSMINQFMAGRYLGDADRDSTLIFEEIVTSQETPIKYIHACSDITSSGRATLIFRNSTIYGNIVAGPSGTIWTHTGDVEIRLSNTSIRAYGKTEDMLTEGWWKTTGGVVCGTGEGGNITGTVDIKAYDDYYAENGTWFSMNRNEDQGIVGNIRFLFRLTSQYLEKVGTFYKESKIKGTRSILVRKSEKAKTDEKLIIANMFGWDIMDLQNCQVTSEEFFGHMQSNWSYFNYASHLTTDDVDDDPYVPAANNRDMRDDLDGETNLTSTTLYSGGIVHEDARNRQWYQTLKLKDNSCEFKVNNFALAKYNPGVTSNSGYDTTNGSVGIASIRNGTNVIRVITWHTENKNYKANLCTLSDPPNSKAYAVALLHVGEGASTTLKEIQAYNVSKTKKCSSKYENSLIAVWSTHPANNTNWEQIDLHPERQVYLFTGEYLGEFVGDKAVDTEWPVEKTHDIARIINEFLRGDISREYVETNETDEAIKTKKLNNARWDHYGSGTYTIYINGNYVLDADDIHAICCSDGLAGKKIVINMNGGTITVKETTDAITTKGLSIPISDAKVNEYRWWQWRDVNPGMDSLKWVNTVFRWKPEKNDTETANATDYYMCANGRKLSFENCTFQGEYMYLNGGIQDKATGYGLNSELSFVNCKNIGTIYANCGKDKLESCNITVDHCTGVGGEPIKIISSYDESGPQYGITNLTIHVKDSRVSVTGNTSTNHIITQYTLESWDAELSFQSPYSGSSKVCLHDGTVLTGTCAADPNKNSEKMYVDGTVSTKSGENVYIKDMRYIYIKSGGVLKLGDSATKSEGGIAAGTKSTCLYFMGNAKLLFDWAPKDAVNRTIQTLYTDSNTTNNELSITYDYEGSGTAGRPLIVKGSFAKNSSERLRVSTTMMPTHKGTEEYVLIDFNSTNSAKIDQYQWIADQRYYIKIGKADKSQIVLREDTFAPLVYQQKVTDGTWSSNTSITNKTPKIYVRDYHGNGIDLSGKSVNGAYGYQTGAQVYVSTRNVPVQSSGICDFEPQGDDKQLTTYTKHISGSITDIQGNALNPSELSPVYEFTLPKQTYSASTNYFIYVRDVAGNWSKFLLDTKAPTLESYSAEVAYSSDKTYSYTFTLSLGDTTQGTNIATTDLLLDHDGVSLQYKADAAKYAGEKVTGVIVKTYSFTTWQSSHSNTYCSTKALGNNRYEVTLRIDQNSWQSIYYIQLQDSYGNFSKFQFCPIVYDATNGDTTSGTFDSGTYGYTVCQYNETMKAAQVPTEPYLKNVGKDEKRFQYWYKKGNTSKTEVTLTSTTIKTGTIYYPKWSTPVLTLVQKSIGDGISYNQDFQYVIQFMGTDLTKGSTLKGIGGTTISGVSSPGNQNYKLDSDLCITVTLRPGQSMSFDLSDLDYQVKITQIKGIGSLSVTDKNGSTVDITQNQNVKEANETFTFTNTYNLVATGMQNNGIYQDTWTIGVAASLLMILYAVARLRKGGRGRWK